MNRLFILREASQYEAMSHFIAAHWQAVSRTKPLSVAVRAYSPKRSSEQNKRYWAIVGEVAEQSYLDGRTYSGEAWHEYFKRRFIGVEDLPDGGCIGISSASLSVEGFAEFMTKVEFYVIDALGCELTA